MKNEEDVLVVVESKSDELAADPDNVGGERRP